MKKKINTIFDITMIAANFGVVLFVFTTLLLAV